METPAATRFAWVGVGLLAGFLALLPLAAAGSLPDPLQAAMVDLGEPVGLDLGPAEPERPETGPNADVVSDELSDDAPADVLDGGADEAPGEDEGTDLTERIEQRDATPVQPVDSEGSSDPALVE